MIRLNWLDTHVGNLDDAIALANKFFWYLSVKQHADKWSVMAGDQTILHTDNRECVDGLPVWTKPCLFCSS